MRSTWLTELGASRRCRAGEGRGWWRRGGQPWRCCQGVHHFWSEGSRFARQVPLRIRSMCRRVNTEALDAGPQKACFQGGPSTGIWELGPGEGPGPPHPQEWQVAPRPKPCVQTVGPALGSCCPPASLGCGWVSGRGCSWDQPPRRNLGRRLSKASLLDTTVQRRLGSWLGEFSASCATPLERTLEAGPLDFTTHLLAPGLTLLCILSRNRSAVMTALC